MEEGIFTEPAVPFYESIEVDLGRIWAFPYSVFTWDDVLRIHLESAKDI